MRAQIGELFLINERIIELEGKKQGNFGKRISLKVKGKLIVDHFLLMKAESIK
jgi:hypothetical protein